MFKSILAGILAVAAFNVSSFAQTYLEEPLHFGNNGLYVTTFAPIGRVPSMRSFTYRYDLEKRVALWVASPLNEGLIGTGRRSQDWLPDSNLPYEWQPNLTKGFAYGSGYDRGHQIPSAERLSGISNQQTFVFTNATPQLHDFNGGVWAELEKLVRTWAKRSDTLYVVTGILPGDAFIADNEGAPVNIPSAYYKTVLRRNVDKHGKLRWSVCSVIMPHKVFSVGTWYENINFFRRYSLSLSGLEKKTGEKYFPLLKDIIGEEEYARLKASNPAKESWWWK